MQNRNLAYNSLYSSLKIQRKYAELKPASLPTSKSTANYYTLVAKYDCFIVLKITVSDPEILTPRIVLHKNMLSSVKKQKNKKTSIEVNHSIC